MKLTLLGTGTPWPDPVRRGPSSLVETGDELIVVDAGSGIAQRLGEAGQMRPHVNRLLLTHLHSDHLGGIIDFLWSGWIFDWWPTPPHVYGPPGTAEFLRRLEHAFGYDIERRNRWCQLGKPWQSPPVTEVHDGWSADIADSRLTAIRVDHDPIDEAFAFRIDTSSGSVAFSGDTRANENLSKGALGVDILVHEAYCNVAAGRRREALREANNELVLQRFTNILSYHTGSHQVGRVADAAEARHLVLNHNISFGAGAAEFEADIVPVYRGKLTVAADLQTFSTP